MAKLKLKTVQNGLKSNSTNLLGNVAGNYLDESGNVVIESGILDESGNVVDEGTLIISAGTSDQIVGTEPGFVVTATWESGNIQLPCSDFPAVNTNFEVEPLYDPFYVIEGSFSVETEWFSLTGARISINYTSSNGRHREERVESDFFNIPYSYIPPKKSDE